MQKDLQTNKLKFEMHSKPYHYLVNELVQHDSEVKEHDNEEKVYVNDLNRVCIKLSEKEGLSIDLNTNGLIDGRLLNKAIKDTFDLHDYSWNGKSYGSLNDFTNDNKRFYPELYKKNDKWEELGEK